MRDERPTDTATSRWCGWCQNMISEPHVCPSSPNKAPPQAAAHGCICPPGAEATCQGFLCPRRARDYRQLSGLHL